MNNTRWKQYVIVIKNSGLAVMISLGLVISGCGKKTETTKPAVNEKEHTPSWLFVVQAESGKITQLTEKEADNTEQAKKKYTLTLSHTDTDHVIAFTDRPDRIVKYEPVKQLEGDWSKGNDSFKKNPPNAVLSSAGIEHPVIVVLDSMKTDGATTTFTFHSAKDNPTDGILSNFAEKDLTLENVVVTIDDLKKDWTGCYCASNWKEDSKCGCARTSGMSRCSQVCGNDECTFAGSPCDLGCEHGCERCIFYC